MLLVPLITIIEEPEEIQGHDRACGYRANLSQRGIASCRNPRSYQHVQASAKADP
jgi:hypothetical protein